LGIEVVYSHKIESMQETEELKNDYAAVL